MAGLFAFFGGDNAIQLDAHDPLCGRHGDRRDNRLDDLLPRPPLYDSLLQAGRRAPTFQGLDGGLDFFFMQPVDITGLGACPGLDKLHA
jgi:hypothetical protein